MLNYILSYAKCAIDFYLFCWLYSFFFKPKYNILCCFVLIAFFSTLLMYVNTLYIPWLNTCIGLLISVTLALVLFDGSIFQILLCVFLSVSALLGCEFIPIVISSVFIDRNIVDIMNQTIYDATFNLISSVLFFSLVSAVRIISQKGKLGISTNNFIISLPLFSLIVIYFVLYTSIYTPSTPSNAYFYLFLYISIITVNILVILGDKNAEKKLALEQEIRDLKYKKALTDALISQQTYHIEELNGLRHDFKRQLLGLYSLSSINELGKKYVDEVSNAVSCIHSFSYVESLPLRMILNSTYNRCMENGIDFITDIRYSNFDFMTYPDIYSFFDNALENAIEACVLIHNNIKKYVSFSVTKKSHFLLVQIENPYEAKAKPAIQGFLTSKLDAKNHGYGTKNMYKVASKYQAHLFFETEGSYKMSCIFTNVADSKKNTGSNEQANIFS